MYVSCDCITPLLTVRGCLTTLYTNPIIALVTNMHEEWEGGREKKRGREGEGESGYVHHVVFGCRRYTAREPKVIVSGKFWG